VRHQSDLSKQIAVDNFVIDIMNEERGKRERELRERQAVPAPEPVAALTPEPPPPPQAQSKVGPIKPVDFDLLKERLRQLPTAAD
jgi:hypothetical protein